MAVVLLSLVAALRLRWVLAIAHSGPHNKRFTLFTTSADATSTLTNDAGTRL